MTAKQYMNRARRVDSEIESLMKLVQKTRESLESITQSYTGDIIQSSKNPHKYDRLVELESLVDEKIAEQIKIKEETLETISQLKDRRQREVLIGYYLNMNTWEQVAVDMNYSYMHITRLHGYALKGVEAIINKENML